VFIEDKLYEKILQVMPISCVDLLVMDEFGRILLLRRKNEPAAGQWWFPGGRVQFKETRTQAARRKLKEECGLESFHMEELGTDDALFEMPDDLNSRHCIATLFRALVRSGENIVLDQQSYDYDWRMPGEWLSDSLHFLVKRGIVIGTTSQDVEGGGKP
jgi:colanic acid biosynthesis protein WcaH